jgi:leucyl-tRNA synthetase
VPDEHLPWKLPEDVDFEPTGEPPLAKSDELFERTEEIFGEGWTPETETMDTFVDSSWYYLRYPDPHNDQEIAGKEALQAWCPVDTYVGGSEHAVMHLLYARFITKALADMDKLNFREPFESLRHPGMILAEGGEKMSKSKGNVVNPSNVVDRLGADTLRMYELFAGPFSQEVEWDTDSIAGPRRFIERVWRMQDKIGSQESTTTSENTKKVTNEFRAAAGIQESQYKTFVKLLAPFAPHVSEEIWHRLGAEDSIHKTDWPEFDPELVKADSVTFAIQVDGQLRGELEVAKNTPKSDIIAQAKAQANVAKHLENTTITRNIFVPGELVNFVTEND